MDAPAPILGDSTWSYEELASQADSIRKKINRFRSSLGRFFVDKQELIDLMVVSAIAQEPLLIVGPPGTAKSDLVIKFKDALGVDDSEYFEYMLTRFSEPSELIGPVDINALREGQYVRRGEGKLPTAQIAFLDEVFKSNSAILNILLTIINERKIYQDGQPVRIPLQILFAATNEIPEHDDLDALKDRFTLKAESHSVADQQLTELLDRSLQLESCRVANLKPWQEGLLQLADLQKAHRLLSLQLGREQQDHDGQSLNDRQAFFPDDVLREFQRLIRTLTHEHEVFISDRRIAKLYKLLRARAWLESGGTIRRDDLRLLMYLGNNRREMTTLRQVVPRLIGLPGHLDCPPRT